MSTGAATVPPRNQNNCTHFMLITESVLCLYLPTALNQMTDEEKSGSRVVGETVRQATTSTSTAVPPTARGAGPGAQADTGNSTTPCNLWLEKDKEQQQLMDQNGQTGKI